MTRRRLHVVKDLEYTTTHSPAPVSVSEYRSAAFRQRPPLLLLGHVTDRPRCDIMTHMSGPPSIASLLLSSSSFSLESSIPISLFSHLHPPLASDGRDRPAAAGHLRPLPACLPSSLRHVILWIALIHFNQRQVEPALISLENTFLPPRPRPPPAALPAPRSVDPRADRGGREGEGRARRGDIPVP